MLKREVVTSEDRSGTPNAKIQVIVVMSVIALLCGQLVSFYARARGMNPEYQEYNWVERVKSVKVTPCR